MDTYLVTFSINLGNKLKEVYEEVKRCINSEAIKNFWGKSGSCLEITKTTFLITSDYSRDSIRNKIEDIFKRYKTDGTILIVEIKLSGWCFHGTNGEDAVRWMRKNISCIDD